MRKLLKDKKGFSLSSWIETAMFSSLFVLLIFGLFAVLNVQFDSTAGNIDKLPQLSGLANTTKGDLSGYQSTLQQSVSQGESSSSGLGVSLSTTWNIISQGSSIIWTFLTGGWIPILGGMIGLPSIVGTILQILFVLSVGLVILRLVLKIRP